MADIFLSYASQDRDRARQVAEALQEPGWSVFWDRRIPPGRTWHDVLEHQLSITRCVVVLWSQQSVGSKWVREEAREGERLGLPVIPALLEEVLPPFGFREVQAASLIDWNGERDHGEFVELCDAVSERVSSPADYRNDRGASTNEVFAVGQTFKDGPACPEMVVVPAGSLMMGSPETETDRHGSEGPQHRVTIAEPFAVGRYPVTFEEWDACVAEGGCDGYQPDDNNWGRGRRPVINVSWDDAHAYVQWLSAKAGQPYRLPTEAEWEYVARAGTTTRYWWGDDFDTSKAAFDGRQTEPVGSFDPNPFGLYDTAGNVWEWVENCRSDNYEGAPSDGSAWTSGDHPHRVLRGGSWGSFPGSLRSAARHWNLPYGRFDSVGFRVVCRPHSSADS